MRVTPTANRKKLGCAETPATAGRVSARMTFSDFGAPVSVTAPPASEVFTPANIQFGVSPGPQ